MELSSLRSQVPERAPNENLAIREMDERKILARFEKRNILDSNDPMFDIIIQQNEIVTMKYGGGCSRSRSAGVGKPSDSFWTATKSGVRFLNLMGK